MHPSKFLKEADCRVSIELGGIYDSRLKEQLMTIHPMNILQSEIILPFYEISIEYDTANHNHRSGKRYMISNTPIDVEEDQLCFMDFEAEYYLQLNNEARPENPMRNLEVISVECICELVLRIA